VSTPLDVLREQLLAYDRLVVAFSGGVDSALLATVAHDVLGPDRAVAVTAVSQSLAPSERTGCRTYAESWGLRWLEVQTDELARPSYVANGTDRCYHCKSELMDHLLPIAEAEGGAAIALAVNVDDLHDHRPGQSAARERGAVFPLVDAGFTKADVRSSAKTMGLEVWDKPAAPCLASRIPYGTPVTMGTLGRVARAKEDLKALGYRDVRVRHYGELARVELPEADLERAIRDRAALVAAVRSAGYRYVTLDLDGLRSGNLNNGITR
jgi:pyridinium-3,5-biscarboxylic acid mononucleotide sulfurtransferase